MQIRHRKHIDVKNVTKELFAILIEKYAVAELAERIEISDSTVRSIARKGDIDLLSLQQIVSRLGISVDHLKYGGIDLSCVYKSLEGDDLYLHSDYLKGAYSKSMTFGVLADFSFFQIGTDKSNYMLNCFQVGQSYLKDKELPISIKLLTDFLRVYTRKHFDPTFAFNCGLSGAGHLADTVVQEKLLESNSYSQLYEIFFLELIPFFEKNCNYSISDSGFKEVVVNSTPIEEVSYEIGEENAGSVDLCLYKMGLLTSLPRLTGQKELEVTKSSCVHHGDNHCTFHINIDNNPLLKIMH